jgi:hypothetical protein
MVLMMSNKARIITTIDMAHESQANIRWPHIARIAVSALASAFALLLVAGF